MKITKLLTGALTIAVVALTPAAMANDGKGKGDRKGDGDRRGGRPGGARPDRAAILKEFDTDKDGKLSTAERVAMIKSRISKSPEMEKRLLSRFDEDKSGDLSDAEIAKAAEAFGKGRRGGPPRGGGDDRRKRGGGEGDKGKGKGKGDGEKRKGDGKKKDKDKDGGDDS